MTNAAEKKRVRRFYGRRLLLFSLLTLSVSLGYTAAFSLCEAAGIPVFSCRIKEMLGIYCPGCGGSRSLRSLLRLDILSSLFYYPALPLCALLLFDLFLRGCITLTTGEEKYIQSFRFRAFWLVLLIVLFTFLLRNLLLFFGIDLLGDFSSAALFLPYKG